ncbi:MAG: tRNA preQ1(34) S-adenosylmethionine ribosyltransferase-isomerase QueA [Hyphomicrobium sp.]|nr:tRNA preQ1(34) S-adenosylmethionine ribosyltransferase-isomerase QueA [Hyphomicrobium sp.]
MRTDIFDFDLPEDRIALYPAEPRDRARMLTVAPGEVPEFHDAVVSDLATILRPGDAIVFNDTRVIPAALEGRRVRGASSAKVAFNLLRRTGADRWRAFARPAKRLVVGDRVAFQGPADGDGTLLSATISERGEAGEVELVFELSGGALDRAINEIGAMPLPPYIALKRAVSDADRASYQTLFAARDGAVAAPTAGLHFTPELVAALDERGVARHTVTLHVGAGTFLPVKAEDTRDHTMHTEWAELGAETAAALADVRLRGGRVVAVGTTVLRTLEAAVAARGGFAAWSGETSIFITPGYRFRAVDVLMTNFHLPRSTLFMLVSAFSGIETMKAAYSHAIANGYRFYSYGDACLLFPEGNCD